MEVTNERMSNPGNVHTMHQMQAACTMKVTVSIFPDSGQFHAALDTSLSIQTHSRYAALGGPSTHNSSDEKDFIMAFFKINQISSLINDYYLLKDLIDSRIFVCLYGVANKSI